MTIKTENEINQLVLIKKNNLINFIYFRSKLLSLGSSVSFTEGSNVQFEGPNFNPQNFNSQKVILHYFVYIAASS